MQTLNKLNNNKYFKWSNIIILGILFIFETSLRISLQISGDDSFDNPFLSAMDNNWVWVGLSTYLVLIPGINYLGFYKPLLKGKIHMDLLIALAIHISYIFSLVVTIVNPSYAIIVEPIGLLFVFDSLGKEIENIIQKKNDHDRVSLESLKFKEVMMGDGTMKSVNDVKVGEVVMFHKGEIIQFDGVVSMGEVIINTSNINGESKPYYAKMGSSVTSGTKLESDMLMLKVSKVFKESTLNKLVESIAKTNTAKPKMQTFADKLYKIFVPTVLLITILSTVIWMTVSYTTDITPFASDESNHIYNSLFVAISVLAISCPCAMTMAAPLVSYVTAQSYWRNNIVFNKIEDMETINKVTDVILDKTGTITTGEMTVAQSFGNKKAHSISAALEESVYHPIASAIFKKYKTDFKVDKVKNIAGKGVSATINKKEYLITSTTSKEVKEVFNESPKKGTIIGLYENKKLVAAYVLTTEIKKGAKQLLAFFKERNINPIILSGDNEDATKELANKLGINYRANQSPEDKAKYIQSLQRKGKVVMMIGDGLNDSIAIKYADVSLSFAQGSNVANSYSSVSLLGDELTTIIYLFKMSKKSKNNYMLALFWAMIFNVVLVPVAALGLMYPWASAVAMYLSNIILYTVIVIYWFKLRKLEFKVFGHKTIKTVERNEENVDNSMSDPHAGHDMSGMSQGGAEMTGPKCH